MSNAQKELDALLLEMQELQERRKFLKRRLADAEDLRKELLGIEGNWGNNGKLGALDKKIEIAQLKCADSHKPAVVFEVAERWGGSEKYIVRKVTAQRIYIAVEGSKYSSIYKDSGEALSGQGKIDIEKTFGGPVPTPKEWKAKYD